jgi:hypothetical protein
MPKHVTISMLDGYKATAADLADPTATDDDFLTLSVGDTVVSKFGQVTAPADTAAHNVRRAIEEGTNTSPAAITLYGVKSTVTDEVGGLLAIDADSLGITLGANVLPKSNSLQFRQRLQDAFNALEEGLV